MSGEKSGYALVEASEDVLITAHFVLNGGSGRKCRTKSPKRIVDEMEHYHREYGISFFWLTDDNFGLGNKTNELCDELIRRRYPMTFHGSCKLDVTTLRRTKIFYQKCVEQATLGCF